VTRAFLCLVGAAAVGLALAGCGKTPSPTAQPGPGTSPWFEDATEKLGLSFVHNPGAAGAYFMPESVGSGVALLDFDNDGRLDIYLIQNAGKDSGSANSLFHQEADGRFKDVSRDSGLQVAGRGMGAAVGDVNNDGWVDVVVTEYRAVRLFLNTGKGAFEEVPLDRSGLDNPLWAISASFVDYDRDGWLDLVVANYVEYDPKICVAFLRSPNGSWDPRSDDRAERLQDEFVEIVRFRHE
jgi:enediyne biosynthesis protein E4